MVKTQPEDFDDIENKGADTPFCNVGGCALGTQCLFALRTKDPKSSICFCFPRMGCWLLACAANLFLAPFVLVLNWFRIYVLPCAFATIHLVLAKFCCDILGCGSCFPKYRDPWFPATDASIAGPRQGASLALQLERFAITSVAKHIRRTTP